MELDCENYSDNKKCPKKLQIIKKKSKSNSLNVIMTGCWGVYCWDGEKTLVKYNPPENPNDVNEDYVFFEEEEKTFGSKRVVNGMIKYTNKVNTGSAMTSSPVDAYEVHGMEWTGCVVEDPTKILWMPYNI